MRHVLSIVVLCLLVASFTGCKKAKLRAQVTALTESTIVLPEEIACVFNEHVYPMPDSLRERAKLIVFVDSTECSKCRISRFIQYEPFFRLAFDSGKFDVLLLLSIKKSEAEELVYYLTLLDSPFPIYVDVNHCFMQMNPVVPSDSRLHSMLVDRDGHPLLIGDPASSDKIKELFINQIMGLPL